MLKPVKAMDVVPASDARLPAVLAEKMHGSEWRTLGTHFGLSRFGVNLETLAPGSQSSLRHWHTEADEFVYMMSGVLMLKTDDGEHPLTEGMCVGFKAGIANAHHLLNRSDKPATFLVVGSRTTNDKVSYPDDDLQWLQTDGGAATPARKDGTLYNLDD